MTKFTIDVANDDRFNAGWACYALGLPRPDPEYDGQAADGWDMASETPTIRIVRRVFDQQESSAYVVSTSDKKPEKAKPEPAMSPLEERAANGDR
jgi:hypothetical protein